MGPKQRWTCATGPDAGTECNWSPCNTCKEKTVTLPNCSRIPAGFRQVVNTDGMCPDPYPDQQGQWGECRPRGRRLLQALADNSIASVAAPLRS